jgi:hypothetical protein
LPRHSLLFFFFSQETLAGLNLPLAIEETQKSLSLIYNRYEVRPERERDGERGGKRDRETERE